MYAEWSEWFRLVAAFLVGAWVYRCGQHNQSIIPGAGAIGAVAEMVRDKLDARRRAAMPKLPSVTS